MSILLSLGCINWILPPCNYCHHSWCASRMCCRQTYHKGVIIMFICDDMSDHVSWNEVFHYHVTALTGTQKSHISKKIRYVNKRCVLVVKRFHIWPYCLVLHTGKYNSMCKVNFWGSRKSKPCKQTEAFARSSWQQFEQWASATQSETCESTKENPVLVDINFGLFLWQAVCNLFRNSHWPQHEIWKIGLNLGISGFRA